MDDSLEQKRIQRDAIRRGKLEAKQHRDLDAALKQADQMTSPKVENTVIDYAARTEQIQSEMAERSRNVEARESELSDKGFNDIEFLKYDTNFRRLSDFIGINPNELSKFGNELSVIMGWAIEQAGSEDITDVLHEIKKLKKFLGFQEVGASAIKKLYRSIRLDLDSKRTTSKEEKEWVRKEKELLKA